MRATLLGACIWLTACMMPQEVTPPSDFLIAKVEEGDTFSSIALRYLKDPSLAWLVKEFNRAQVLTPGQTLLIPLRPYRMGGVAENGYQLVPIFAYSWPVVSDPSAASRLKDQFRRQMTALRTFDYTVISLPQLLKFLEFETRLPSRSLVITVDDPHADFFEIAYPVIRQFGYPVSLFVQTDRVGSEGHLSWVQLSELAANGFDIQSRGRSRLTFTGPEPGEDFETYLVNLELELVGSKTAIEENIGRPCRFLAYPSGAASSLSAAYAEKTGYDAAFTTDGQPPPFFRDRYRLGRILMTPNREVGDFLNLIKTFKPIDSE
ncbi:MAG: polysaccharide deacetylase family protein [Desulfobacterales bacterium]|jgi:peptidoglycan/xylan/chitin deacetylase (PgdA/CDA1 family)